MIRVTMGAAALAFAASAQATNFPETPPAPNSTASAQATGGDSTSIGYNSNTNTLRVGVNGGSVGNVSAGGGSVGNVGARASGGSVGNVGASAGGGSAVTGPVSQQGGDVQVAGPTTNVRASSTTYSATQPPAVAGGSIAISVSACLPFRMPDGTRRYEEVKVGGETWFIGHESADAAGNFGTSDARNVGAQALLVGGQVGVASGNNKPGWASMDRECIALKQSATPPPAPAVSELTVHAPTTQAVQRKIPCKVERFTDSKGKAVDMCRGPQGSWTKTEMVAGTPVSVRVTPTTDQTQVTSGNSATVVQRQGNDYVLGSHAPTVLMCDDCPPKP